MRITQSIPLVCPDSNNQAQGRHPVELLAPSEMAHSLSLVVIEAYGLEVAIYNSSGLEGRSCKSW